MSMSEKGMEPERSMPSERIISQTEADTALAVTEANVGTVYALRNVDGWRLAAIVENVRMGGTFRVYQYTIGLPFLTINRPSPIWFVSAGEDPYLVGDRYSRICNLVGWLSISGMIESRGSRRINMDGGIDMTGDVLRNLTGEDLAASQVTFHTPYQHFLSLPEDILEQVKKRMVPVLQGYREIREAWIGRYINTDREFYVIGVDCEPEGEREELLRVIKREGNRSLFRSPPFTSCLIDRNDDVHAALIEQGSRLYP